MSTSTECEPHLREFFEAIDNYDLWKEGALIKFAVKTCIELDETVAKENYKLFVDLIFEYELSGTSDLLDPIRNFAEKNGL